MDIRIEKTQNPGQRPDENSLGFGKYYTDHMFTMEWDAARGGWHSPAIRPFQPLTLSPAAQVFHYAQECFEGLKAYRRPDGGVQLFRPERNAARMAATCERLCMPKLPAGDFVEAVQALVDVDRDWVPSAPETSLYIRPTMIATEPHLGVKPSDSYLFFIILSPSGAYYSGGLDPVKIYVEDELTRAAPGGTGAVKCGGNYAASLAAQMKAQELGYSQVLWLDGAERRFVEEVGSMNCFFKIGEEIVTAPTAAGTVLPGITRMSCMQMLKDWGYTVREEAVAIDDLMAAADAGRLEEVFGTGTAAVISPVGELRYRDKVVRLGEGVGPVTKRLYDELTGIQWGTRPDPYGWTVVVE